MNKPRIVATIKANNRSEAIAALELLYERVNAVFDNESIDEQVEVTNEGEE